MERWLLCLIVGLFSFSFGAKLLQKLAGSDKILALGVSCDILNCK